MKSAKITVDILMLVFIILSLIRWDGDPTFHIAVGSACALLFIIHLILNIKPFTSMTKRFAKLKSTMKLRCAVDWILIVVWSVAIIAGFIAIPPYLSEEVAVNGIGRIHGVFARIGCGVILIHLIQHLKQIRSYFRRRTNA
jgi:hypothetical protein